MFELIFIFILIYFFSKKNKNITNTNIYPLLNRVFQAQQFTNINKIYTTPIINYVTADANGENFIFAFKNNTTHFTINELESLYEKSEQLHIHNIVIINTSKVMFSDALKQKIKDYNIDVWNMNKLLSLCSNMHVNNAHSNSNSPNNISHSNSNKITNVTVSNSSYGQNSYNKTTTTAYVLRTSNTSDDTCKIDSNSFDPIQENTGKNGGFFSNLFKKPERL